MTNLSLIRPIAFIDIETTGLNTQLDRIVEISIIKIHPDEKEELLSSRINPEIPIPIETTKIHGITNADVEGKPTFKEFAMQISQFLEGCDLCGFGLKFDLTVLEREFRRTEINYSLNGKGLVDVKIIYHKLEPRDLSAAYAKYCGKPLQGAHNSEVDARATIAVLEAQLKSYDVLPRDIRGLHELCNPKDQTWIDHNGKFVWRGKDAIINFGIHRGRTLQDLSKNSPDYLQWIISKDFSAEVKKIAENAINDKFPEPKKLN